MEELNQLFKNVLISPILEEPDIQDFILQEGKFKDYMKYKEHTRKKRKNGEYVWFINIYTKRKKPISGNLFRRKDS